MIFLCVFSGSLGRKLSSESQQSSRDLIGWVFFTFFFLFYLRRFPKHRTEKKLSLGLTLKIMCLALCSQPIDPHDIIFHNNIYPPAVDDNNKKNLNSKKRGKKKLTSKSISKNLVFRLVSHVDSICVLLLSTRSESSSNVNWSEIWIALTDSDISWYCLFLEPLGMCVIWCVRGEAAMITILWPHQHTSTRHSIIDWR